MTTPPSNYTRSGLVQRYGPLTAICLAIALVGILVTIAGGDTTTASTGGTGAAGADSGSGGGGGVAPGDMPISFEQAKAEGREKSIQWVDNCDLTTGRIKMPSKYALPCVPKFTGDNGGETGPGVTKDKITVVYYLAAENGDIMAQLQGNIDTPEAGQETVGKFNEMLNDLAETYGRTVEIKAYQSKSPNPDPVAARAEAQEVIDTYRPFASIGGPGLATAYAEEMAAQGVLCLGCGGATSDEMYQKHAPYMWGASLSAEEWLTTVSEYIGKRLSNRPAKWAGDAALQGKTRKFGVVNFEQDPPQFSTMSQVGAKCEELARWKRAVQETYLITTMTDRAPTIIAKLKAEGITSVVFMGDPIMPTYLTQEATKQNYFPEWIITGTAFTDSSTLARRYDQRQWAHAFGLSPLSAYMVKEQVEPWRLHEWYFGTAPTASKTSTLLYSGISQLYNGIHMAGPNLSAKTFGQGLFNLPPAGGGPTTPRISYGDRGTFPIANPETCTADKPRTDYLGIDDMVEIWWDAEYVGPDEQGTSGKGKYWYANGGKRYLPGQQPDTEADAFKRDGALPEIKQKPPEDQPPSYPSPRK